MSCYIITFLLKSGFAACCHTDHSFFNKTIIQSVKSLLNHKLNPLYNPQYNNSTGVGVCYIYSSYCIIFILIVIHFTYIILYQVVLLFYCI